MKTYTYSEARQKLAALLDLARREGRVQIRRRDGQLFILQPAKPKGSPLDVPGVQANLQRGETLDWLKTSREDSTNRLLVRELPNKRVQPAKSRRKSIRSNKKTPKANPRG